MSWRSVIKIGGSLMDYPQIYNRLETLTRLYAEMFPAFIIVGGARSADLVRYWDKTHGLPESVGHELAMEAMRFNSLLLQSKLQDSSMIVTVDELSETKAGCIWGVIDPIHFIGQIESLVQPKADLKRIWPFTSDSIAAWLAVHAHQYLERQLNLILLKSTLPEGWLVGKSYRVVEAQQAGLIDECFAEVSKSLEKIKVINLRDDQLNWCELIDA